MKTISFIIMILVFVVIVSYFIEQSNYGISKIFERNTSSTFPFFSFLPKFPKLIGPVPSVPSYSRSTTRASPNVISSPSSGSYSQPAVNPTEIPSGFTAAQLSPYFHKIRLGSVSPGSARFQSTIYVYDYSGDSQKIDVTGWNIQANRGSVFIPQAVDLYDPSGMTAPSDIYLINGGTLKLYSGSSAIGENIRLNECIGYLNDTENFSPSLNDNCPYIDRSQISNFTGQCQSYILSLGNCQLPAANPPVPNTDYACINFLNNLNYGGCFRGHRSDSDFLGKEWDAWVGSQFLDYQHDRVLLLDRNGLLVDEYSY